jgi:hypothetical protein
MTRQHHILAPKEQLEAFCKKHFIGRLSLFGSVLRDDFKPESDVDILVNFSLDTKWVCSKWPVWKRNYRKC